MVAVNYLDTNKDVVMYKAGDVIFNRGDEGDVVYGILEGRVQVIYNNLVIDTLDEGDIVGEDVMLGKKHYGVTAIAVSDVRLSAMNRHRFLWLVQQTPTFATQLMSAMSERVEKVAKLLD